ncbi:MAG: hypothetical protein FIA89_04755 [Geobacter sp.]|nr:hypothetical protein [Geobacter sp.]
MFDSAFDQLLNLLHPGGREGRLEERCRTLEQENSALRNHYIQKNRINGSSAAAYITRNTFH